MNGNSLNDIRCETNRSFRKKEGISKKNELEANKNIRDLYRSIHEFKKGYQPITNLVKDENGDVLADSCNILNSWKNYFCQLLNLHGVNDVRQREMHAA
jgi:hypothetical protein